jgi:hypothetical protein
VASLSGRTAPRHLFGLAPTGVYPATSVAGRAVRSYRTFSPLPDPRLSQRPSAVCSLWHFPSHRRAGTPRHYLAACPWSPDFPRHPQADDAIVWPEPLPWKYSDIGVTGTEGRGERNQGRVPAPRYPRRGGLAIQIGEWDGRVREPRHPSPITRPPTTRSVEHFALPAPAALTPCRTLSIQSPKSCSHTVTTP